jgi:hypothetical protein
MSFVQVILWLVSVNATLSVETVKEPLTEIYQYYDGQNFWPCFQYPEGVICQKDSNEVVIYVPVRN